MVHTCPLLVEYGIKIVKDYVASGDEYFIIDSTYFTLKLFEMFSFKNQKGEKLYILDENVYLKSPWTDANGYTLPFFAHYVPELTGLAKIIYDQSYHI